MILNWTRCSGNQWCNFLYLNLDHNHFNDLEGVYIIWHGAPNPAVVCVGQGNIRERLRDHRKEQEILAYTGSGLYTTWSSLDKYLRDGVERYLVEKWKPKIGNRFPDVNPIAVNSPWQ